MPYRYGRMDRRSQKSPGLFRAGLSCVGAGLARDDVSPRTTRLLLRRLHQIGFSGPVAELAATVGRATWWEWGAIGKMDLSL